MTGRLPVRYLFEPKQGKGHALNRILDEAAGQWVLFTDDDVKPDPDWLATYASAIERFPEADCFGGPVLPWLARPARGLTRYFLDEFPWVMSVLYVAEDMPIEPRGGRFPYGNNMALRRDVARALRFHTARTMKGAMRGDEDTDLLLRLLEQGRRGRLLRDAKLLHYIPPQRSGLRWFIHWNLSDGRHRYFTRGPVPGGRFGVRWWLWKLVVTRLGQAVARWRPGNPKHFYECLGDALHQIGHTRATDEFSRPGRAAADRPASSDQPPDHRRLEQTLADDQPTSLTEREQTRP